MYYTNGNYEAFARPRKPGGAEQKSAWLVGSGLASLSAAAFLIRDGQMPGDHIHILEEASLPGGACDGLRMEELGFVIRAAGRWRTTTSACGTCTAPFPPWRWRGPACWTSSTG